MVCEWTNFKLMDVGKVVGRLDGYRWHVIEECSVGCQTSCQASWELFTGCYIFVGQHLVRIPLNVSLLFAFCVLLCTICCMGPLLRRNTRKPSILAHCLRIDIASNIKFSFLSHSFWLLYGLSFFLNEAPNDGSRVLTLLRCYIGDPCA